MYTRAEGIKRKWKKRSITPLTSIVSPIQRDAVYLNEKNIKWVTINICRNSMQGKVENEIVGEP
jgi:hypothetical protein